MQKQSLTIQTNTTVSDVDQKPSLLIYDGELFDNMDQVVILLLASLFFIFEKSFQ